MKLTRQERKQVFDGTLKVLRRPSKPDQEAGAKLIVSQSLGGKHIVDRSTGETVDLPKQPRLWIVIKGWHLKQGETEWQTDVTIHDLRETNRELASGIGGHPREAGLKTRSGTHVVHHNGEIVVRPKRVPTKAEQKESWTPETERGYGGSAGRGLDQSDADGQYVPATAVDDETLNKFAAVAGDRNIGLRTMQRKRERGMREEIKVAGEHRRAKRQRARAAATQSVEITIAHRDRTEEALVEMQGGEVVSVTPAAA